MTTSTSDNQKLSVTIYASAQTSFEGTREQLEETFPDIYMADSYKGDQNDLGANDFCYSVDGDDEMVVVDKGLLMALVAQCQDYSDNELVINPDTQETYEYKDLNKFVMGMTFTDRVSKMLSAEEYQQQLDCERTARADNLLAHEMFEGFSANGSNGWKIDGDTWVTVVQLKDDQGNKANTTYRIMFDQDLNTVDKTVFTDIEIQTPVNSEFTSTLTDDRRKMAENIFKHHDFEGYLVNETGNWSIDGDVWSTTVYLMDPKANTKAKTILTITFLTEFTNAKSVKTSGFEIVDNEPKASETPEQGFDILKSNLFLDHELDAITAVNASALEANVSPTGFTIDESFTDCGGIEVAEVVSVLELAALQFGEKDSMNYNYIIEQLCESLNNHFSHPHH